MKEIKYTNAADTASEKIKSDADHADSGNALLSMRRIIRLDRPTFNRLRDYIYTQTGIFIPDKKLYLLQSRLQKRIRALQLLSFIDYFRYVQRQENDDEINKLINAVTTNETYFWREPRHFDVMINVLIPALMQNPNRTELRIWSAACSTGEEIYTIALLLHEYQYVLQGKPVTIWGSDISSEVLEKARIGLYNDYAMRNVAEHWKKKYFDVVGEKEYQIKQYIRDSVIFKKVNLFNERDISQFSNIDILLCRNVMIYFHADGKRTLLRRFRTIISPDGFLLVGHSESLHAFADCFTLTRMNKTFVYVKT